MLSNVTWKYQIWYKWLSSIGEVVLMTQPNIPIERWLVHYIIAWMYCLFLYKTSVSCCRHLWPQQTLQNMLRWENTSLRCRRRPRCHRILVAQTTARCSWKVTTCQLYSADVHWTAPSIVCNFTHFANIVLLLFFVFCYMFTILEGVWNICVDKN